MTPRSLASRTGPSDSFPDRRLPNGTIHCSGSATYQIWFRLPIPNPYPNPKPKPKKLTLTLTPTRTLKVTKMYAVQNDTGIKFNIELYIKRYFPGT